MVVSDDRVEFFLGVLGISRKVAGNMAQDCDLLGRFNGDRD